MSSDMWRSSDTGSDIGEMISPRKDSLPSPNLEDSFFPFSTSSQQRGPRMSPVAETDPSDGPQDDSSSLLLEQDLILAAELGRALLERNEELTAQLEKKDKDSEVLEQEKHVLQRKLEVRELESGQREAELQADITALREQLDKQRNQGRDRRREESEQLTQLSNHNQKLVEQLAEAVALEHTLRSELRTLREDMDDRSLSNSISSARMESLMAENRLLQERYGRAEERLRSAQEDGSRLRAERDGLRQRVTELQTNLEEREGEAKEAIQVHSELLQEKESEIQKLKEELQSREGELQSLKEDLQAFRHSPGQPSYSFLEAELAKVRQERDSLTQQLMNTIKHKVALSQEVDAWQEDMRLVICQQVEEREKERVRKTTLQRGTVTSRSLRMRGEEERPRKGGFFSSFFSKE
ncbi:BICD family-like cargo adapter 2 isoform X3 [Anguilla rostrata]|uniref:BICD family-like cargo adapter 2 isoform X4 n=1 Tax=Anguilla anguilla TaxID=7936 RepID=UPI0015A8D3F5|nr:BICD family-like cargo adapter 2 isoform X4 [Anguilla anguilla]